MKAGLQGKCTNHGLKATSATRLFREGVLEQMVCDITGNTSKAMRVYKQKSSAMQREISDVLYGNQMSSMCVQEDKKSVKKLCPEHQNESVKLVEQAEISRSKNCVVDLKEKGDGVTSNVTYNKQKIDDKCIVNVYRIAGGLSSGHPIIVNVHVNIDKD